MKLFLSRVHHGLIWIYININILIDILTKEHTLWWKVVLTQPVQRPIRIVPWESLHDSIQRSPSRGHCPQMGALSPTHPPLSLSQKIHRSLCNKILLLGPDICTHTDCAWLKLQRMGGSWCNMWTLGILSYGICWSKLWCGLQALICVSFRPCGPSTSFQWHPTPQFVSKKRRATKHWGKFWHRYRRTEQSICRAAAVLRPKQPFAIKHAQTTSFYSPLI